MRASGKKKKPSLTAQNLLEDGYQPLTPDESLKKEIMKRINHLKEKGMSEENIYQSLFPNTILPQETFESLLSALLSGNNVLFFGPPGSGKTILAKDVWNLFPKRVYAVDGCPVQDDPFSIIDKKFGKVLPACPLCQSRFGGIEHPQLEEFNHEEVEPSEVPVKLMTLREGYGLARIQGSPEVFPDNLTGTLNIHKLEEIGDPTSPEVLQPGKLLQANRGLLLIDEIGKLPRGTQNVLLQALQEGIVTPAKSRATFPAFFVAITNSNIEDLHNINEPLNDRLTNIYVGYNREHYKNRKIIEMSVEKKEVFMPDIFFESAIYLMERWRENQHISHELSEVGSNRAMTDIIKRSQAYAFLKGKEVVEIQDFQEGTTDSLVGRIRARGGDSYIRNHQIIQEFINEELPRSLERAGKEYWCRFFFEVLKKDRAEGKRVLKEIETVRASPEIVMEALKQGSSLKKFKKYGTYILQREDWKGAVRKEKVVASVLKLQKDLKVFEEKDILGEKEIC